MGKQSVEVRNSSSLNNSGDGLPCARHHLKIGSAVGQLGGRDAREHAQNIQVGEMLVVFAGRGGAIQNHRKQALALGVLETIHQFLELVFHAMPLPTSRSAAAARIPSAKTAEASASTTAAAKTAATPVAAATSAAS